MKKTKHKIEVETYSLSPESIKVTVEPLIKRISCNNDLIAINLSAEKSNNNRSLIGEIKRLPKK